MTETESFTTANQLMCHSLANQNQTIHRKYAELNAIKLDTIGDVTKKSLARKNPMYTLPNKQPSNERRMTVLSKLRAARTITKKSLARNNPRWAETTNQLSAPTERVPNAFNSEPFDAAHRLGNKSNNIYNKPTPTRIANTDNQLYILKLMLYSWLVVWITVRVWITILATIRCALPRLNAIHFSRAWNTKPFNAAHRIMCRSWGNKLHDT